MQHGNALGNRQAQTAAGLFLPFRPGKAFLHARQPFRRHAGAVVTHRQAGWVAFHPHLAAGRRIADGVVDQVAQQDVQQAFVAGQRPDGGTGGRDQGDGAVVGGIGTALDHPAGHGDQVGRPAVGGGQVVEPGQCQQLLDQAGCAVDAGHHLYQRLAAGGVVTGEHGHFGLHAQGCQRRAQLVGSIGGEAPFVGQGGVEPGKQAIERHHQRADFGRHRGFDRLEVVGRAFTQVAHQPVQRQQAAADGQPHQYQQHRQRHQPRHHLAQHQPADQPVAGLEALADHDVGVVLGVAQVKEPPLLALEHHVAKAAGIGVERQFGLVDVGKDDLVVVVAQLEGDVFVHFVAAVVKQLVQLARQGRADFVTLPARIEVDRGQQLGKERLLGVKEFVDGLVGRPVVDHGADHPGRRQGDHQRHQQAALERGNRRTPHASPSW